MTARHLSGPFARKPAALRPLKDRLQEISLRACAKMNPKGRPLGAIIAEQKARLSAYQAERQAREIAEAGANLRLWMCAVIDWHAGDWEIHDEDENEAWIDGTGRLPAALNGFRGSEEEARRELAAQRSFAAARWDAALAASPQPASELEELLALAAAAHERAGRPFSGPGAESHDRLGELLARAGAGK